MKPADQPTPLDDQAASLLAAYDDALMDGTGRADPVADFPAELQPRLERALGCLHRLEQVWPRGSSLFPRSEVEAATCPLCGKPLRSGEPSANEVVAVEPLAEEPADQPSARGRVRVTGYEILGELGRGGMGVVYRARQICVNRLVALKMVLAGPHAGLQELARFRTEAEAVGRLQHPNIVQVYDVGFEEGCPYLSLELLEGGSLAQMAASTPQPARQAAALLETLARTIHFAHQHGIVHRDLKPANVLLTSDGTPKISDFGLAKHLAHAVGDGATFQTRSGAIVGTPCYMAPEQAAGKSKKIGPAADIYSLGAILYELLTGRPPFKGDNSLEAVRRSLSEEPEPPRRLRPGVPRDLETVCLKCLEKEPGKRYASALALADDVNRFLRGEPVQARPVRPAERLWRWCRRNPVPALLSASIFLLLVAVAVGSSLAAVSWREQRDTAIQNQGRAEKAEQTVQEKLRDSLIAQAEARRRTPLMGRRFASLQLLREAAQLGPSLELRNQAIACLTLPDLRPVQLWEKGLPAFSTDLKWCAQWSVDGVIRIRRTEDGTETARLQGAADPAWIMQFSPDNRFVAARCHPSGGDTQRILLWDLRAAEALAPVELAGRVWDFSPDGRVLAASQPDRTIVLYDLATLEEVDRLPAGPIPARLAFHPGGRRLAFSSLWASMVTIWDLDTREQTSIPQPAGVRGIAWSFDGRFLASACADRRAYVIDSHTTQVRHVLEGHQGDVVCVAFDHRGELLATTGWDGTLRLWDLHTGRETARMPAAANGMQFSPDDRLLGFESSSHCGIWEVYRPDECRILYGHEYERGLGPSGVEFSPDGRLLASCGADGVRLWDALTGEQITFLWIGHCKHLQFLPDGTLVTGGPAGLQLWECTRGAGDRLDLGPPRDCEAVASDGPVGLSADGSTLAVLSRDRRCVLLRGQHLADQARRPLWPPAAGTSSILFSQFPVDANSTAVAVSPHSRWIATGTYLGFGVRVWDARSGKPVLDVPDSANTSVQFSPDDRWFVASTREGYRLYRWESDSWKPGTLIPRDFDEYAFGPCAFSPDGSVLAIVKQARLVQLIDPVTGQALATLTPPDLEPIAWLSFSPDGSRLAVACATHRIQLWDLRRIREQLGELGVAEGLATFPAPSAAQAPTRSARVNLGSQSRFTGRELPVATMRKSIATYSKYLEEDPTEALSYQERGVLHGILQEYDEALADYRQARKWDPSLSIPYRSTAWILAMGPEHLRDVSGALPLAQTGVQLAPNDPLACSTLGAVYYRCGKFSLAIDVLQRAATLSSEGASATDLFLLAMSYHGLGEREQARAYYRQAVAWLDERRTLRGVLRQRMTACQREAEATLGSLLDSSEIPGQ